MPFIILKRKMFHLVVHFTVSCRVFYSLFIFFLRDILVRGIRLVGRDAQVRFSAFNLKYVDPIATVSSNNTMLINFRSGPSSPPGWILHLGI